MKMLVKTMPQACPWWASVEIPQSEIQPAIQVEWEVEKLRYGGLVVDGRPITQTGAEERFGLAQVYPRLWRRAMWEGLVKQNPDKSPCFLAEIMVVKEGDRYAVRGVFFWEPELKFKDPELPEQLKQVQLPGDNDISVEDIKQTIDDIRSKIQFSPHNVKEIEADTEEFKLGDKCTIESTSDMGKSLGEKGKQRALVVLSDKCPEHIRAAVLGKRVGDSFVMAEKLHEPDGTERQINIRAKITARVVAPEVSDELLLKFSAVNTWKEMVDKVRTKIKAEAIASYPERLMAAAMMGCECGPVPAALVWDRAEGALEFMIRESGVDEQVVITNMVGRNDKQKALESMLPAMRRDVVKEVICAKLARELGIWPSFEDVESHAQAMKMDLHDPPVYYAAERDLMSDLVLKYYEREAIGKQKRIILTGDGPSEGRVILPG